VKKNKLAGFSLVQVIVAATLMAGLAFSLNQFFVGAFRAQKHVQNTVEFDILVTQLNLLLTSRACDGAFRDTSGVLRLFSSTPPAPAPGTGELLTSPLPVEKITQGGGSLLDRASPNLGGGLTLDKLEITSVTNDGTQAVTEGTPPVTTTYPRYLMVLAIGANKAEGSLGRKRLDRSFSVKVLVDPLNSHRVVKCASAEPPAAMASQLKDVGEITSGGTHTFDVSSLGSIKILLARHCSGDSIAGAAMLAKKEDGTWHMIVTGGSGSRVSGEVTSTGICSSGGTMASVFETGVCARMASATQLFVAIGNCFYGEYMTFR